MQHIHENAAFFAPVLDAKESKAKKVIPTRKFLSPREMAQLVKELHQLAAKKDIPIEIFNQKLRAAVNIDSDILMQPDSEGNTLLHLTAMNGDIAKTNCLFWFGITELRPKNKFGQTPTDLWPKMLTESVTDPAALGKALRNAAYNDSILSEDFLKILIGSRSVINQQDTGAQQKTALHRAVEKGHRGKIQALLMFGADINIKDKAGQYPVALLPPSEDYLSQLLQPKLLVATDSTIPETKESKKQKWSIPTTYAQYADQIEGCEKELTAYTEQLVPLAHTVLPDALKAEKHTMASLLFLFRSHLKQFLTTRQGERLDIVSLGARHMDELIPLLVLAKEMGIKVHLYAIDDDPDVPEVIKKRYHAFKDHFTYIRCDASKPQVVASALKQAGIKSTGADVTLLRQPDSRGSKNSAMRATAIAAGALTDISLKTRAAFHDMVAKTMPYISSKEGVAWFSWMGESEAAITCQSLQAAQGIYEPLVELGKVKPGDQKSFVVGEQEHQVHEKYAAIYRCKGLAFCDTAKPISAGVVQGATKQGFLSAPTGPAANVGSPQEDKRRAKKKKGKKKKAGKTAGQPPL